MKLILFISLFIFANAQPYTKDKDIAKESTILNNWKQKEFKLDLRASKVKRDLAEMNFEIVVKKLK